MTDVRSYHYFLGGNDLEMEAIRKLLRDKEVPPGHVHDKRLGWGAKASDYGSELENLPKGAVPVLIELANDLGLDESRVIIVDHHGERAGEDKPTSLEQMWRLLEMAPEQWGKGEYADFPLIAANDRGYIPAMRQLGASEEKIADIRRRERAAQGITEAQEQQTEQAIRHLQTIEDRLTVVHLPHTKTAPVTDRLALKPGHENILIISPKEINFFGDGRAVCRLHKQYPGGWYGGALPQRGYWGHGRDGIDLEELQTRLLDILKRE
jgi:hypothetical protein